MGLLFVQIPESVGNRPESERGHSDADAAAPRDLAPLGLWFSARRLEAELHPAGESFLSGLSFFPTIFKIYFFHVDPGALFIISYFIFLNYVSVTKQQLRLRIQA